MSKVKGTTTMQPSKNMSTTTEKLLDYTSVPDETLCQMLSTAFHGTDKLGQFLNEKGNIEFVRHYTGLIGRLSYVKLQQLQ
jgi:hypothetical protein